MNIQLLRAMGGLGGGGLLSETLAFKQRVNLSGGSVTNNELTRLNNIIKGLKSNNIYEKLDELILPGLFINEITAKHNIINANYTASLINNPLFVPRAGWIGNGSTSAINTKFNPASSPKISLNNASYGCYLFRLDAPGMKNAYGTYDGVYNVGLIPNLTTYLTSKLHTSVTYASENGVYTPVNGLFTQFRTESSKYTTCVNLNNTKNHIRVSDGIPNSEIYLLALNSNGSLSQFSEHGISVFYSGNALSKSEHDVIYELLNDNLFILQGNVLIIGDSTIDAYLAYNSVAKYLSVSDAKTITNISEPGETIDQQKARYDQLSLEVKSSIELAFIEIGLNDLQPTEDVSEALARYDSLVNDIKVNSPFSKIICCTMTPCRKRLIVAYGETNGPIAYQKWLDMNSAIRNNQFNVNYIVSNHTDLLNDGSGNLLTIYDIGDGIHENNLGRSIVASEWLNYKQ